MPPLFSFFCILRMQQQIGHFVFDNLHIDRCSMRNPSDWELRSPVPDDFPPPTEVKHELKTVSATKYNFPFPLTAEHLLEELPWIQFRQTGIEKKRASDSQIRFSKYKKQAWIRTVKIFNTWRAYLWISAVKTDYGDNDKSLWQLLWKLLHLLLWGPLHQSLVSCNVSITMPLCEGMTACFCWVRGGETHSTAHARMLSLTQLTRFDVLYQIYNSPILSFGQTRTTV